MGFESISTQKPNLLRNFNFNINPLTLLKRNLIEKDKTFPLKTQRGLEVYGFEEHDDLVYKDIKLIFNDMYVHKKVIDYELDGRKYKQSNFLLYNIERVDNEAYTAFKILSLNTEKSHILFENVNDNPVKKYGCEIPHIINYSNLLKKCPNTQEFVDKMKFEKDTEIYGFMKNNVPYFSESKDFENAVRAVIHLNRNLRGLSD